MAHTQDPTQDHTPDRVIHYAPGSVLGPGDRPLCGNESSTAVYSEDPRQVAGCADCLELVAKALATQRLVLQLLRELHAGDLRPGRTCVAEGRPEPLPGLRTRDLVSKTTPTAALAGAPGEPARR